MDDNTTNNLYSPLFKEVSYKIEVLKIEKEVFENEVSDIIEWLKSKSSELGCGIHKEYYGRNEDFRDDIPILFRISLKN